MTALALAAMAVYPEADGNIRVGNAVMPAWAAQDLAVRILEMAKAVPATQRRRVVVREHLDRMFAHAKLVGAREVLLPEAGRSPSRFKVLAYREGNRAHVRIGDTTTAWLRREGSVRARGMLMEWHLDSLYGPTPIVVDDFARVSIAWASVSGLPDRTLEVAHG